MSFGLRVGYLACAAALPGSALHAQRAASDEVIAQRVDSAARAFMDRGFASVSLLIMRGPDTVLVRAWGTADLGTSRAATPATTYRLGSTSKQFTAALILKLVDQGRLTLTDSIGRYLTGLRPEWRTITIEQLLNHTSGLQREYRQASRRLEKLPGDTLIAMATRDTMVSSPGARYAYSNTGYMILGVLVEKLYGKPYSDVLRNEVSRPLGLTTLAWCTDPAMSASEAKGYQRAPQGDFRPALEMNPDQALGAGSICGSVLDLASWNRALHAGRVLSPASYQVMTTPRGAAASARYGFGLVVHRTPSGRVVYQHTGATPGGFASENAWFPGEGISVSVLYNTTPPQGSSGLLASIAEIIYPQPH